MLRLKTKCNLAVLSEITRYMTSAEDCLSVYLHKLQYMRHLLGTVCQFICTNYKIHDICWGLSVSLSAQITRYMTSDGDCLSVYLHKLQDTWHLMGTLCQFLCTNYKIHDIWWGLSVSLSACFIFCDAPVEKYPNWPKIFWNIEKYDRLFLTTWIYCSDIYSRVSRD